MTTAGIVVPLAVGCLLAFWGLIEISKALHQIAEEMRYLKLRPLRRHTRRRNPGMPNITTCPNCGKAYEAESEEAANAPQWGADPHARYCPMCRYTAEGNAQQS